MARKGGQIFINIVGDSASAERAFERLQRELTGLGRGVEKAGRRMGDGFVDAGRKMSQAGSTLTRNVTLPIVGLGAVAVKSFADFDAAMTQSTAIMGNVSDDMRKKMETTAREVAKTTTFNASQAAESYFFLASAGLDAAASIEAMPKVASFAQAGMFDMARATDLLTDAQSALGLTVRDNAAKNMQNMVRVSDVLVKANVLANASVEQFSEALTNKAGAAARALGKDVEEAAAVLAAFADQGVKGTEAGEALNIVWRDLQRAAIKNEKEFRKFGVSVFDSSGEMRSTSAIVKDLEGALKGMSDKQKRATLTTLGFQDKSVSNLITLLGTSDAIARYERELRNAGNTTEQVAKKQLQTPAERLKLMKDRLLDVALQVGPKLIGPIEQIAGVVVKVVEAFAALPKPVQTGLLSFLAFGAALGPMLKIAGNFTIGYGKLLNIIDKTKKGEGLFSKFGKVGSKAFGLVKTAVLGLKSVALGAFAMLKAGLMSLYAMILANPIILVWAAVAAAVAAIVILIIRNWESFKRGLLVIWNAIKAATLAVWNAIKGAVTAIWNAIKGAATAVFNAIRAYFRTTLNIYRTIFVGVWRAIRAVVVGVWNAIKTAALTIFNAIKAYFQTVFRIYKAIFTGALNVIRTVWTKTWTVVRTIAVTIWNQLIGKVRLVKDAFVSVFRFLRDAVVGAIKTVIEWVKKLLGPLGKVVDLGGKVIGFGANVAGKIGGGIKAGFKAITPFAHGGTARAGQLALVGEEGPELVRFGARAHVSDASETRQMLRPTGTEGGSITQHITIVNPKPEAASTSLPRAMRRAAFMRGR